MPPTLSTMLRRQLGTKSSRTEAVSLITMEVLVSHLRCTLWGLLIQGCSIFLASNLLFLPKHTHVLCISGKSSKAVAGGDYQFRWRRHAPRCQGEGRPRQHLRKQQFNPLKVKHLLGKNYLRISILDWWSSPHKK